MRRLVEAQARLLQEINDGNVRGVEQQLDAGGERLWLLFG